MALLEGEHIRLRALEPGDIDLLYEWENDTAIWNVSNTISPYSRFQLEQYVLNEQQDLMASRQLRLMVEVKNSRNHHQPAGTIDLFDYDPLHARTGVGILIRDPYRSKGYATEAMDVVIRYAFGTLNLHQLFCNIAPTNTTSLKLFDKLGFVRCGIRKDWIRNDETWHEEWMFQLINHEK